MFYLDLLVVEGEQVFRLQKFKKVEVLSHFFLFSLNKFVDNRC